MSREQFLTTRLAERSSELELFKRRLETSEELRTGLVGGIERLRADAIDRILEAHGQGQREGWTDALDAAGKLLESCGNPLMMEVAAMVRKLNPFSPPTPSTPGGE